MIHDIVPAEILALPQDTPEEHAQGLDFEELLALPYLMGRHIKNLRVVVMEEEGYKTILIAADSFDPSGTSVVFAEQLTFFAASPVPTNTHRATTLSGKTIVYRKDEKCNCGSRLKSWSPFKAFRALSQPQPKESNSDV